MRFRKGEDKFENITNGDLPEMRILLTNTRYIAGLLPYIMSGITYYASCIFHLV